MDITPPTARHGAVLAAGLTLALTLTACNDDSGDGASDDLTWEDSPIAQEFADLDALVGWGDMTDAEINQMFNDMQVRTEELTARCMAEQGFEYNAVTYTTSETVEMSEDEDIPEWGTQEFAEQYGYGVFTREDITGEDLLAGESEEEWVDPNEEILHGMSQSELDAWSVALWGEPEDIDPDADVEDLTWDWESSGCTGWAQHEAESELPGAEMNDLVEDPRFTELLEEIGSLSQAAEADPKTAELDVLWAECMADAGYDFQSPSDAEDSVYALQDEVWGIGEDLQDVSSDVEAESEPEAMAQAKEQEIATATADYGCRAEMDYDSERLAVEFEHEAAYIEENQALFDELIAEAERLGSSR